MILQTIKKGVRNDTFEESQVIQCFDVIIEKDMLQISNAESSDEELEIRQKNFNKARNLLVLPDCAEITLFGILAIRH